MTRTTLSHWNLHFSTGICTKSQTFHMIICKEKPSSMSCPICAVLHAWNRNMLMSRHSYIYHVLQSSHNQMHTSLRIDWLTPERCDTNFSCMILKHISLKCILSISCEMILHAEWILYQGVNIVSGSQYCVRESILCPGVNIVSGSQ